MSDLLILVDKDDNIAGYEEKERCHLIPTKLHRAFSIFILSPEGKMLIHRRSLLKKTWPGFWTNACCSHPRKGESLDMAVARRLQEELGFVTTVTPLFAFRYEADYDGTYGENEIDHVFLGTYAGEIKANADEIDEWKFVDIEALKAEISADSERFTPWFKKALPGVLAYLL